MVVFLYVFLSGYSQYFFLLFGIVDPSDKMANKRQPRMFAV